MAERNVRLVLNLETRGASQAARALGNLKPAANPMAGAGTAFKNPSPTPAQASLNNLKPAAPLQDTEGTRGMAAALDGLEAYRKEIDKLNASMHPELLEKRVGLELKLQDARSKYAKALTTEKEKQASGDQKKSA